MKDIDIAWAAGLFEGEGCISRSAARTVRFQLKMQSCDHDVIERFHQIVGLGQVYGPLRRSLAYKPFWIWTTGRAGSVACVLEAFLPYLGKRRSEKAVEAIAASKDVPPPYSLDEDAVRRIKLRAKLGLTQRELGLEFGVNRRTIGDVLRGNSWQQVS